MQKKNLNLLLLIGVIGIASANASSSVTITALKSPVWVQQDNSKTELGRNSKLNIGDNIATGDAGRVEIQLWVNARLQLNSNSEITFRAKKEANQTAAHGQPELYLREGRACIKYTALSSSEEKFVINIGDMMFAAIHLYGDICLFRVDGLSSIKLRAGSVQVTHAVDPNMIILSESGTEFHIEDDGSYKLLFPGDDVSNLEIEKPFIVETVVGEGPVDTPEISTGSNVDTGELTEAEFEATGEEGVQIVDKNDVVTDGLKAAAPGTVPQDEVSGYIYTVYLFSTRDEEVAEEINRRFQQAGHDTRIVETTTGSVLRYRVVAPGFESSQAAKNFSDAIVGTLGVTQTWIGKEKSVVAETVTAKDASGEGGKMSESDNVAIEQTDLVRPETTKQGESPGYTYTVYLFSSRSVETAKQVNRKFLEAGHDTQIFEVKSGTESRYRVAAPGFESRQAAKAFSDAIVGTLDVTQTWIGRDTR